MSKSPRTLRTDGEATHNCILEAAGELFAERGFAETTNKAVAARAEVDVASINYHFESRVGLYQAVLAEAHRRIISLQDLQRIIALDQPADVKLRTLIESLVDGATGGRHRWYAKVLGRELLSPTSSLRTIEQSEVLPKLKTVLAILSEITSIPVGHPALLRCMVSVAAPCAMLVVAGQNLSTFADKIHSMPRDELVAHHYSFAIGGLQAISRDLASIQSR